MIRLEWATAVELNNAGFIIERSTDAQNWIELGRMAASEQLATKNVYRFDDHKVQPGVIYYYRVTQMDLDGKFEQTEIKTGMLNSSSELAFHDLVPNPANDRCSILLSASEASEAQVLVSNAMGQMVFNNKVQLTEGRNEITLELSGLSGGAYTARVSSSGITISKKLIIAR